MCAAAGVGQPRPGSGGRAALAAGGRGPAGRLAAEGAADGKGPAAKGPRCGGQCCHLACMRRGSCGLIG